MCFFAAPAVGAAAAAGTTAAASTATTIMAYAGLAATLAGTAMSVYGNMQAGLARYEGATARKNAWLSAGSSLLSGLGTAGMRYAAMSDKGMFGGGASPSYYDPALQKRVAGTKPLGFH